VLPIIFLVAGIALIASELFHLSLVPLFLGASALITAGLLGAGVVTTVPMALLAWSVMSLALAVPLRPVLKKLVGGEKGKFDPADEDKDAAGTIVEVLVVVDEDSSKGRIRYQGTSWAAQSTEGVIPVGARAKLVGRKKLVWFIEPLGVMDGVEQPELLPPANADDAVPPMTVEPAHVDAAGNVVHKKEK
jgi:membrane protein implicated in regulation of membrane protease activity